MCFTKKSISISPRSEINSPRPILKNKRRNSIYPSDIKLGKSDSPKSILKNKRRNSIHPNKIPKKQILINNKKQFEENKKKQQEFTEKFVSEIITCGACCENFSLKQNAIKINCGSCNKFFHCSIAGACVGPNCSIILDGKKESLKYCMSCVNPYLKINIQDNNQCLCKICEKDPETDKIYLKV